jgi:flagellar basal body rod protein FlgG
VLISDATMRAMSDVAAREREVLRVFTPAAEPAGNPSLSAAAPPGACFIIAGDRGRTLFTQDGNFEVRHGMLTDTAGRAILGYAGADAPLSPLRMDAVDAQLALANGMRVQNDGSLCYERVTIDPRSGRRETESVTIGRIALARFPSGAKLQPVDAAHVAAPAGVEPHIGVAGDGNFAPLQIVQGPYGSEDLDRRLQRMQEAYLALDAVRAASKAQDSIEKTAMDLLK